MDSLSPEMILQKERSIIELVEALNLDDRGWAVSDHWDGDLCAIGIASKSRPNRLVYVSTFDLPPGRYYCECEVGKTLGELPYAVADSAANVDLAFLEKKMTDHLGVNETHRDNGPQMLTQVSVKV